MWELLVVTTAAMAAMATSDIQPRQDLDSNGGLPVNSDDELLPNYEDENAFNYWNSILERANACEVSGGKCMTKKTAKKDCKGKLDKKLKCDKKRLKCCINDEITTLTPCRAANCPPCPTPGPTPEGVYKVVCYFTNWAWYRPGIGKYTPDEIDPTLCTHIVYGFAVLDPSNQIIKSHDPWADIDNEFYKKVTDYKSRGIKVTLAIGGWTDSADDKYSSLVNNPAARAKFVAHVVEYVMDHNFDGLDLDWEYPVCWQVDCSRGPSSDKEGFANLVKELSAAFKPKGLLLSAAVSPSKKVVDAGYDVPVLSNYMDWIAVMTYDFHGQWDKKTGHNAPMYHHPESNENTFNVDYAIKYWIKKGAAKNKLVVGMPLYGQSFTINDPSNTGLNSPASSGGTAGEFTRAAGMLAYYEICEKVRQGWKVVQDPKGRMGPYAYSGNQWVSYDDAAMIKMKSQYIRDEGLAGGMVWALDFDDFTNRCGQGKNPLLKAIKNVLGSSKIITISGRLESFQSRSNACTDAGGNCMSKKAAKKDCNGNWDKNSKCDKKRQVCCMKDACPVVTCAPCTTNPTFTNAPITTNPVRTNPPPVVTTPGGSGGGPCQSGSFKGNPSNCSTYFQCVHGNWVSQNCPSGLHWNQTNTNCDWPQSAKCESSGK
ncbi:unnamed protein product [Meganyctiphanes norvegica]|uniref:Chitinase n=1 Tax=Meganyctiphanes norvegica TaxID=48144 RepID=A0AAV2QER2_MEGNR